MKIILLAIIYFFNINSYAKDFALIFGGNCEEGTVQGQGDRYSYNNKFLPEMVNMTQGLVARGWSTKVNYDGRFARCTVEYGKCEDKSSANCCPLGIEPSLWNKKELEGISKQKVGFGSKEALIESLKRIQQESKDGKNKILIAFNTHGSQKNKNESHGICLSDGSMLPIDDPDLNRELKKISTMKNNQLSVMDLSCYSGSTVEHLSKILDEKSCILSAQSDNRTASFDEGLVSSLSSNLASSASFSMGDLYMDTLLTNIDNDGHLHEPSISDAKKSNQLGNYSTRVLKTNYEDIASKKFCYKIDNLFENIELGKLQESLEDININSLKSELKSYKGLISKIGQQAQAYNYQLHDLEQVDCSVESEKMYEEGFDLEIDISKISGLLELIEKLVKKDPVKHAGISEFVDLKKKVWREKLTNAETLSSFELLVEDIESRNILFVDNLITEDIVDINKQSDIASAEQKFNELSAMVLKAKEKKIVELSKEQVGKIEKIEANLNRCEDNGALKLDALMKLGRELSSNISLKRYFDYNLSSAKSPCRDFKF